MKNEIPFSTMTGFAAAAPAELESIEGGVLSFGSLLAGAALVGINYVVTKAVVNAGLEIGYEVREFLI